ncbi:MAG: HlyD family efflux transporter periplasmic adaptor subunit, partial [Eubacteriales bacterium]
MNPTTQSPDVVTDKKPVQIWLDKLKKIPKKHLTSTLCVTLVAVGGFQGYSLFFVEEDAVPLTTTVSYGQLGTTIEGSGTATSAQTQSISAASNSEILGVYVSPGDTVEAGQLLYIQDDTELDELIEDYEAQIAEHQSTIADYYATIAEYQSDISDLQEDINNASIKASFHGKVTEISHKVGDNVNSGNQLAQLTDSSKMEVVLYFSYAYENDISIGDSATISIAEQMLVLTGTVTNIKKVEYITTEG